MFAVAGFFIFPTSGSATTKDAPVNTAEPQISGSAVQGQVLTGTTGTWSNNPTSFAFQWLRCPSDGGQGNGGNCATIDGATASSYTVAAADVGFTIRVRVTASNADGSNSAASNATAVVKGAAAPVNTTQPAISGSAVVGQMLTATTGTWSGNPTTFAFQWLRCPTNGGQGNGGNCAAIAGAVANSYVVAGADVGFPLRVRVTATSSAGGASAASNATAIVQAAPPVTGCPAGTAPVQISQINAPARLQIDQQQASPQIIPRRPTAFTIRYHVSDTCGQSVVGALVYVTANPYNQLSSPGEQATDANGWVEFSFTTLSGYPTSPRQELIAMFVRAADPVAICWPESPPAACSRCRSAAENRSSRGGPFATGTAPTGCLTVPATRAEVVNPKERC